MSGRETEVIQNRGFSTAGIESQSHQRADWNRGDLGDERGRVVGYNTEKGLCYVQLRVPTHERGLGWNVYITENPHEISRT